MLDQVHFKKIYNNWISQHLYFFLHFLKNYKDWIKSFSKSKWTGLKYRQRIFFCHTNECVWERIASIFPVHTATLHTANMCSGITVEVHFKNCNFEKLQFFTVDHSSLYFLPVKNCDFSIILHVIYSALNWMLILQVFTVFKNTAKKL